MYETIHLASSYVPVCCGRDDCGQRFAMSTDFYNQTHRTGETWYCPSGHPRCWRGDTTEQKLAAAQARAGHLEDQLRAAIHDGERVRVALLRDRQRFANGVCPCCNRSFEQLARHVRTQHPDYDVTKVEGPVTTRFKCSCGAAFETVRGLRIHQGHARSEGWDEPGALRWWSHLTDIGAS